MAAFLYRAPQREPAAMAWPATFSKTDLDVQLDGRRPASCRRKPRGGTTARRERTTAPHITG
jgi:hypothetical protein